MVDRINEETNNLVYVFGHSTLMSIRIFFKINSKWEYKSEDNHFSQINLQNYLYASWHAVHMGNFIDIFYFRKVVYEIFISTTEEHTS